MKHVLPFSNFGRKAHLLMWLGILSLSILGYNNCGNKVSFGVVAENSLGNADGLGGVSPTAPTGTTDPAARLEEIISDCSNPSLTRQTYKKVIEFIQPDLIPGINVNNLCSFGMDDNLTPLDAYYRARLEQVQDFALPPNAVLCEMSFASATQQTMFYDDEMILSFDDIAISSTFDLKDGNNLDVFFKIPVLDLLVYSWNPFETAPGLKGQFWGGGNGNDSYCLGVGSTCNWPATQTVGAVSLNFDSKVFKSISAARPTPISNHIFKLTTTGDNDPIKRVSNNQITSYDCYHSTIAFDVTAEYVTK